MNSKRSARQRLLDILDAIQKGRSLAGSTPEEFSTSWVHRSATERMIEIISEASRHLPPELKAKFPAIPWQDIAGIGSVVRHGYEVVDPESSGQQFRRTSGRWSRRSEECWPSRRTTNDSGGTVVKA